MKRSKAYRSAAEKINPDALYSPLAAVRIVKDTTSTKFDPTVEVSMRLGIDPRKADQMVRGTVNLPHGTGKTARVLVFANGEKAFHLCNSLSINMCQDITGIYPPIEWTFRKNFNDTNVILL